MSKETLEWLNSNTLIGYRDELGKAWHARGDSTNHYDGAVPVEKVRELFNWEAVSVPVWVQAKDLIGIDYEADGYKAVVHPTTDQVFQITSDKYLIHQYEEWLVDEVMTLVDVSEGELTIGTAGLLRAGGQAWVQVRPPEGVVIGGDEQLPWILATTSHDGTLATQYKGQRQRVVCDNTLAIGLREGTAQFKVRHTTNSRVKLAEAREALEIIYTQQDQFSVEVERMMNNAVSTHEFRQVNALLVPEVEPVIEEGKVKNQRAMNNREHTIAELDNLWFDDKRVAPYKDTEWGVRQAHNTWFHWGRTHGTGGDERLMKARQVQSTIAGDTDAYDRKVDRALDLILAT